MININDTVIFFGIMFLFVSLGVALPYIQNDLGTNSDTLLITGNNASVLLPGTVPPEDANPLTVTFSWLNVFISIAKMFVWTFGGFPIWVDTLFLILRITFFMIGFRLIRGQS